MSNNAQLAKTTKLQVYELPTKIHQDRWKKRSFKCKTITEKSLTTLPNINPWNVSPTQKDSSGETKKEN